MEYLDETRSQQSRRLLGTELLSVSIFYSPMPWDVLQPSGAIKCSIRLCRVCTLDAHGKAELRSNSWDVGRVKHEQSAKTSRSRLRLLFARRTNVLLSAVQVCLPRLAVSVLPPAALSERRPATDASIIYVKPVSIEPCCRHSSITHHCVGCYFYDCKVSRCLHTLPSIRPLDRKSVV